MKLDVSSIKNSIGASIKINLKASLEPINFYGSKLTFEEPLHLQGEAINTGESILIKANIKTNYKTECSRCNKPIQKILEIEFCEEFHPSSSSLNYDVNIFEGDEIKLDKVVIGNIILNIPMKILCSYDCKGLCHICGKDLNSGKCNCENRETDSRFAVLKDLFTVQDTDKEV
ncbi:MAG: hypothetical protein PWQ82_907 [Thermosediminibacterales bacterium]|nr:hypothetical protein [Thermosediminibacterales bacterium]MDK2835448.1 hypothetical protein [Thermosediminibacterales bacterium]